MGDLAINQCCGSATFDGESGKEVKYSLHGIRIKKNDAVFSRVSEPACFGTAPAPGIFNPEPAPGKREQKFGFFKTDYELSKIRFNTCTSTYRS